MTHQLDNKVKNISFNSSICFFVISLFFLGIVNFDRQQCRCCFYMAMVLQANRMTSADNSTVSMDPYKSLHQKSCSSTPSSPPRSASPTNNQDDSFRRMIFEKVEEGKREKNPEKCRQILDDLMKMLKHLTADVNNYNLAFRETRPPFYMQVRID